MHALYSVLTGKSDTILDMYDYGGISFIEEKKVDSSYFSSIFAKKKTEYINTAPYWAKYSIKQGLVNAKEGAAAGCLAGVFLDYAFLRYPISSSIETHLACAVGLPLITTIAGTIAGLCSHQKT